MAGVAVAREASSPDRSSGAFARRARARIGVRHAAPRQRRAPAVDRSGRRTAPHLGALGHAEQAGVGDLRGAGKARAPPRERAAGGAPAALRHAPRERLHGTLAQRRPARVDVLRRRGLQRRRTDVADARHAAVGRAGERRRGERGSTRARRDPARGRRSRRSIPSPRPTTGCRIATSSRAATARSGSRTSRARSTTRRIRSSSRASPSRSSRRRALTASVGVERRRGAGSRCASSSPCARTCSTASCSSSKSREALSRRSTSRGSCRTRRASSHRRRRTSRAARASASRSCASSRRERARDGGMVRVSSESGASGVDARADLARPRLSAPPPEVLTEGERWIDVDLASQTLVAYAGKQPVFATLVSTGKGPPGSEFVTRTGTFRIWVKVFTTKMDNLDKDDVDRHYAIEDVPWVQFFDKAIALPRRVLASRLRPRPQPRLREPRPARRALALRLHVAAPPERLDGGAADEDRAGRRDPRALRDLPAPRSLVRRSGAVGLRTRRRRTRQPRRWSCRPVATSSAPESVPAIASRYAVTGEADRRTSRGSWRCCDDRPCRARDRRRADAATRGEMPSWVLVPSGRRTLVAVESSATLRHDGQYRISMADMRGAFARDAFCRLSRPSTLPCAAQPTACCTCGVISRGKSRARVVERGRARDAARARALTPGRRARRASRSVRLEQSEDDDTATTARACRTPGRSRLARRKRCVVSASALRRRAQRRVREAKPRSALAERSRWKVERHLTGERSLCVDDLALAMTCRPRHVRGASVWRARRPCRRRRLRGRHRVFLSWQARLQFILRETGDESGEPLPRTASE